MRFIDNSPADDRTPEDVVAAGGPPPIGEDICPDCGVDVNQNEGWCKCCIFVKPEFWPPRPGWEH